MAQVSLEGAAADSAAADCEEVRGPHRDGHRRLHQVHGGCSGRERRLATRVRQRYTSVVAGV